MHDHLAAQTSPPHLANHNLCVMMKLRQIMRQRWTVLAICDHRGECQVAAFIDNLKRGTADSRQVTAILERAAGSGPPHNKRKSNPLADGIFELKTHSGMRIPYFYDEGWLVICTEAMHKPRQAELRRVIARARRDRQRYFEAKSRNQIEIIEGES
jgi:hypothetical protein